MFADMHIHTCFSDGTQTPEEVVQDAKNKGISVISVCDHNSVEAYPRLRAACASLGLTLIQGVELEVVFSEKTIHLLAYNFDFTDKTMLKLINDNQSEYTKAGINLIEKMKKDYPSLSMEDYSTYKRPLERGGWKSINYLYDRGVITGDLLEDGLKYIWRYGSVSEFSDIESACKTIRNAGGVPVLAHPGIYWSADEFSSILPSLVDIGIGGIECYYPTHSETFTAMCVDFCSSHNLCITCGCDGHGNFAKHNRGTVCDIGVLKIDVSLLNLDGII